MNPQPLVVVGASAGGVESLMALAASLPADFAAPVLVVLHVAPQAPSLLPQLLRGARPLPAAHAQDGEPLMPGHIYVAPPDRHLLVEGDRVAVTRRPKENRFRPSVDALFRSAAYASGPAVIGVVLSGTLDDGTSGLWAIGRRGSVTVVQEPGEARYNEMPLSALEQVRVDHVVPLAELGALLTRLVAREPGGEDQMDERERERLETEVRVAGEASAPGGILALGDLSPLTCPDCHGTLVRLEEGGTVCFRCHTGHAFSAGALLTGLTETVEGHLWQVVRALEEGTMLLHQLGEQSAGAGEARTAEALFDRAHEAERPSRQVRKLLHRPDPLEQASLSGVPSNLTGMPPEQAGRSRSR